jgi:hypothetical protein
MVVFFICFYCCEIVMLDGRPRFLRNQTAPFRELLVASGADVSVGSPTGSIPTKIISPSPLGWLEVSALGWLEASPLGWLEASPLGWLEASPQGGLEASPLGWLEGSS